MDRSYDYSVWAIWQAINTPATLQALADCNDESDTENEREAVK